MSTASPRGLCWNARNCRQFLNIHVIPKKQQTGARSVLELSTPEGTPFVYRTPVVPLGPPSSHSIVGWGAVSSFCSWENRVWQRWLLQVTQYRIGEAEGEALHVLPSWILSYPWNSWVQCGISGLFLCRILCLSPVSWSQHLLLFKGQHSPHIQSWREWEIGGRGTSPTKALSSWSQLSNRVPYSHSSAHKRACDPSRNNQWFGEQWYEC